MKKQSAVLFLIMMFVSTLGLAQDLVSITAVGSHKYSFFSKDEAREAALLAAKQSALGQYTASLPSAKQAMVQQYTDQIMQNIDQFVPGAIIQEEQRDKKTKQYRVGIMAQVNPGALDAFLNTQAEVASGFSAPSDFGAMFIARVETSRKSFDEKRVTREESENAAILEETNADDGVESISSVNESSVNVQRSGGSTEVKRDSVTYEPSIAISEEVAFAVEEQLVNAGFEPMYLDQLYDYGVPFLDEITGQMRSSGRMPSRIRRQYQKAAIQAGWSFFGAGMIDIGAPQADNARGTVRVPATVSFRVWSLTDGRARTVASVRPQVVYGQDRGNASVAETNAYNEAVKYALETVVAQLQQKGLR